MSMPSLILTFTPKEHPGLYTLSWDNMNYTIELRPEMDVELGNLLRRLHPVLVGSSDPSEKLSPTELLYDIGTRLWQALFPNSISADQRKTLENALREDTTPLLFDLPDTLAMLPWELLCDPQELDHGGFLGHKRPLVRLIPGDTQLPSITPPLRVLLLLSSPPGLSEEKHIDVESERAAVEKTTREFREAGLLHLLVEDIVTPQRVEQALLQFKPHLLHYIGHGGYDERTGGYLIWEDDHGKPMPIFNSHLVGLLCSHKLRAVLLHACQTSYTDADAEFHSTANVLLSQGIPAVMAQQTGFTYESSQRASEMFYTALINGLGLGEATFEARQALAQANRPDWAVPTLQATLGGLAPLFDKTKPSGSPDPSLDTSKLPADLPAPTGVFVGRQHELRTLRLLLESPPGTNPMFALITGPGGVGKSTLVAQAVTRFGAQYKAILTLSCVGYQGIGLFLKQMGEFLQRRGRQNLLERVLPDPGLSTTVKIQKAIEVLEDVGPFLIIIDNLESVQKEDRTLTDPDLLQLLQKMVVSLQNGRALITGRYAVEGLLPADKFATKLVRLELDDLSRRDILQLLDRHQQLAHLSESVRVELVQTFGGFPYVYDLLSSKAASTNLAELIHDAQGRITQEYQNRVASQWQQIRWQVIEFAALEATIVRLPEEARKILAWLSIFRRPFPLEALEQGLSLTQPDWQSLIDWALLRHDPITGNYQLHSLTRWYAETMLNPPDSTNVQKQIAQWYMDYTTKEHRDLTGYLEAHHLFRTAGDTQRAAQVVIIISGLLNRFGLYELWRELCLVTIEDLRGLDDDLVAIALNQLGVIALEQGRNDEAERLFRENLMTYERLGEHEARASTLHNLGNIAIHRGNFEEAQRLYSEALSIFERLGEWSKYTGTLFQLGTIAKGQGRLEEAERLYRMSLSTYKRLGDRDEYALALHQLGIIAIEQGQLEEAQKLFREALTILKRVGNQSDSAKVLYGLGIIAQTQGHFAEAQRLFNKKLTIEERLDDRNGHARTLHQLGIIAQKQGQLEEAQRFYSESLVIFKDLSDREGYTTTLGKLGDIAEKQGQLDKAQQLYNERLSLLDQVNDLEQRAATLGQLGIVAYQRKDYRDAHRWFEECETILEQLGKKRECIALLQMLGKIAEAQGNIEDAQSFFSKNLAITDQFNDYEGKAVALCELGSLARQQSNYATALKYSYQALTICENHNLPYHIQGSHTIAEVYDEMGEVAFMALWKVITNGKPLPDLPNIDYRQIVHQPLILLLRTKTFEDVQEMLEAHPELLLPEADTLLEELVAAQRDEEARKIIVWYRVLLGRCREMGITVALTELQMEKGKQVTAALNTQLNVICRQVVKAIRKGTSLQRRTLAIHLDHLIEHNKSLEDAQDFLGLLAAWLRGEDVDQRERTLRQDFQDAYKLMVANTMPREQSSDYEGWIQLVRDVLKRVDSLLRRGTMLQRQQYAEELVRWQASQQSKGADFGAFLGCLVSILYGDEPDTERLRPPFDRLWRDFRKGTHLMNQFTFVASEVPIEESKEFWQLITERLQGEDVTRRVEALRPEFQILYRQMVALSNQTDESSGDVDQQNPVISKLISFLFEFAEADWTERRKLLTKRARILLSEDIEPILNALLEATRDSDTNQAIDVLRTLLRRCRIYGIDSVQYLEEEMFLGDDIDIPIEYESSVMKIATLLLHQQEDETAQAQAIWDMQMFLSDLKSEKSTLFRAALLCDLASEMELLPDNHPLRILEEMEAYYREALSHYRDSDRSSDLLFIYRSLGSILDEQGRYEEALVQWQAAIDRLKPHEHQRSEASEALSDYASTLCSLGRMEEAIKAYTESIALIPDSAFSYRNRAEAEIHAGRLVEAETDLAYSIALDGNENNPYLWYRRAQVAIARGQGLSADLMLNEVVNRDAFFDVSFLRAQVAWLQGNIQTAKEYLKKSWREANPGERGVMHREMQHLFDQHPSLTWKDELEDLMM